MRSNGNGNSHPLYTWLIDPHSADSAPPVEYILSKENEALRLTLGCIADGVIVTDTRARIALMNPVAETLTGWPSAEVLGKDLSTILKLVNETTHEAVENPAKKALLQGSPVALSNHKLLLSRDGAEHHIDDSAAPIRDEKGNVIGAVLIFRDVSERKKAEAEKADLIARERRARDAAEAANRIKDDFLATLSHELRTPLQAILGWSRLLVQGRLDSDKLARAGEVIERNARAQQQLIDDLLDVSRILSGKLSCEMSRIELRPVVDAALDSVRHLAEARNLQIEIVFSPHDAHINGNSHRLQQVFSNLLVNAIKFSRKGGIIQVCLEHFEDAVEVRVTDNGEGIDPEFLPHVFDRFRQADNTVSRSHNGLGLGLAIVRHLVELHHGAIRAESEGRGLGATFTVRLPLLERKPVPMHKSIYTKHRPGRSSSLRGLTVLIVDDEPDSRDLACRILELGGARVITADSVASALSQLTRSEPNLVLSDLGMPIESGYTLVHKIRNSGLKIPVAALTAFAREEDRMQTRLAGFDCHISKPVDPDELIETVALLTRR